MNCYVGLVKRIVKSCFPRVVPVTQLEPLYASQIIKSQEICIVPSECEFKPISDEDAWAVTVVWAESQAIKRNIS